MHDAVTAERAGVPAVAIMTSGFVDGAELMATALGADGYRFAVIDHPIAGADLAALATRADVALEQAAGLLGWSQGSR